MRVYTCKNEDCSKYLIGGIALCKVISKGAEASLDVNDGTYSTDCGVPVTSRDVLCFHCNKKASQIEFEPENDKPEQISQMIDELDAEIESIMKSLGVS